MSYTSPLVLVLPPVLTNILRSTFNLISTTFPQKTLSFYPLKLGLYLAVKFLESLAYTCCFHCIIHSIMFCYLASALPNLLKWLSQRPANMSKLLNIMALLQFSFLLAILISVFYSPEASDLCWPSFFLKGELLPSKGLWLCLYLSNHSFYVFHTLLSTPTPWTQNVSQETVLDLLLFPSRSLSSATISIVSFWR